MQKSVSGAALRQLVKHPSTPSARRSSTCMIHTENTRSRDGTKSGGVTRLGVLVDVILIHHLEDLRARRRVAPPGEALVHLHDQSQRSSRNGKPKTRVGQGIARRNLQRFRIKKEALGESWDGQSRSATRDSTHQIVYLRRTHTSPVGKQNERNLPIRSQKPPTCWCVGIHLIHAQLQFHLVQEAVVIEVHLIKGLCHQLTSLIHWTYVVGHRADSAPPSWPPSSSPVTPLTPTHLVAQLPHHVRRRQLRSAKRACDAAQHRHQTHGVPRDPLRRLHRARLRDSARHCRERGCRGLTEGWINEIVYTEFELQFNLPLRKSAGGPCAIHTPRSCRLCSSTILPLSTSLITGARTRAWPRRTCARTMASWASAPCTRHRPRPHLDARRPHRRA
jgi:hypothetical protein